MKQREIKFRAWDGNCMMYDIGVRYGMALHLDTGKMKEWPLMQYTGLKDKNGKEIYEGDVVRSYNDYYDGCKYIDLVCVWQDSEWVFKENTAEDGYQWSEVSSELCKVIGNIYENPELLEP